MASLMCPKLNYLDLKNTPSDFGKDNLIQSFYCILSAEQEHTELTHFHCGKS